MNGPGICYCGAYGGGRHTKSARCDGSPEPSPTPPSSNLRSVRSDLITLAAQLVRGEGVPDWSEYRFYQSTAMGDRRNMLKALRDADDAMRGHGIRLKEIVDKLIGASVPETPAESDCPLPPSDRNTIIDAMHYPREYLARWKGKGNSGNAQHTLDRLQRMLERTAMKLAETHAKLPTVEFMNGYISARTDRSHVLGLLHDWFRHHASARGSDGRLLHPDLDVETQRELLKTESSEKTGCSGLTAGGPLTPTEIASATTCDIKCFDYPKCECGRGMP